MLNIESIYSSDSIDQSLSKMHTLNPQFLSVELIPIEYFPCMKQIKLLFLFLFFFLLKTETFGVEFQLPLWPLTPRSYHVTRWSCNLTKRDQIYEQVNNERIRINFTAILLSIFDKH